MRKLSVLAIVAGLLIAGSAFALDTRVSQRSITEGILFIQPNATAAAKIDGYVLLANTDRWWTDVFGVSGTSDAESIPLSKVVVSGVPTLTVPKLVSGAVSGHSSGEERNAGRFVVGGFDFIAISSYARVWAVEHFFDSATGDRASFVVPVLTRVVDYPANNVAWVHGVRSDSIEQTYIVLGNVGDHPSHVFLNVYDGSGIEIGSESVDVAKGLTFYQLATTIPRGIGSVKITQDSSVGPFFGSKLVGFAIVSPIGTSTQDVIPIE